MLKFNRQPKHRNLTGLKPRAKDRRDRDNDDFDDNEVEEPRANGHRDGDIDNLDGNEVEEPRANGHRDGDIDNLNGNEVQDFSLQSWGRTLLTIHSLLSPSTQSV